MPAPKPDRNPAADRRAPRCRTCGEAIDVPEGWTQGPAVRRHYWAAHREVMTRSRKKVAS